MRIKIESWNIWLGKNIVDVESYLREQDADIVGIQEFDTQNGRIESLAANLGYHAALYPSYEGSVNTGKGDAVFSKFPILRSKRHFLSPSVEYTGTPTTEPRIAVEAVVGLNNRTLSIYSTHLGYAARFQSSAPQTEQVKNLATLVQDRDGIVVMGDFNALPDSDAIRTLASVLRHADSNLSAPTFTVYPHEYEDHKSSELRDRVDYIFVSGDISVVDAGVGSSRASNHLPIWATVEV